MADQTPTQKPAQPGPTGTAPSGTSRHRTGSGASRPQTGRHPTSARGRHRHMSTRDINQMLSEMGSYTKYSKVVNDCNFSVKLRCDCARSRNMSWMFLCTVCATGTTVEKTEEDSPASKYTSILQNTDSPLTEKDENKEDADKDDNKESSSNNDKKQRPFLSCDLCAHKITETYYCPNCLNAYPAQYVKQGMTRCPRCVACPVCVSPMEKIVYAGGSDNKDKEKNNSESQPKDSLSAPGGDNKIKPSEPQKIGDKKSKSKDVYLYQCPFCFWSSNLIGLEAATSDVLLQNLNKKIKDPYDKKLALMDEIEGKYNNMNEELRKEEERLHNARHYHKNYKKKSVFYNISGTGTGNDASGGGKKRKNKRKTSKDMDLPSGDAAQTLLLERVGSNEAINAMDKLTKKLDRKYEEDHVMPVGKADNSHISELDRIFVTAFNIQHVSPLAHRLSDPLNQFSDFHKFIPQRFHLMTKESYRCPVQVCQQYVCKPHLRGAQANFEKRTAVLDYLPRVVVEVVSGDLLASATSTILVKFQNRHMENAKMTIDCSVNDKDPLSTAKVECSNQTFDMDPINIHIKVAQGAKKTEQTFENGDYSNGKEVGIHFKVTPKYYTQADIKFSIRVMFETKLEIKKDKAPPKKSDFKDIKLGLGGKPAVTKEIVDCDLPFILDFDLGSAKKLHPSSSGRKVSDAVPKEPIGAVASPSTDAKIDPTTFKTDSTSPESSSTTTTTTTTTTDDSKGHKSRGSNELAKSDAVTAANETNESTQDPPANNPAPADA